MRRVSNISRLLAACQKSVYCSILLKHGLLFSLHIYMEMIQCTFCMMYFVTRSQISMGCFSFVVNFPVELSLYLHVPL